MIAGLVLSNRCLPFFSTHSQRHQREFSALLALFCEKNRCRLDCAMVADVVFLHGFYKFMRTNPPFIR
jgi:hypothetical protein